MDSTLIIDFIIIIILIVASGWFSMSELAVINARKHKLEELAEAGDKRAILAHKLADDPNQMFSTVQIGITLVAILTGLYSGDTFADPLKEVLLEAMPWLGSYAGSISSILIVVLITYLTLIIGELVPKRLAINSPETISIWIARPIYVLSLTLRPIVAILAWSTDLVLKILGVKIHEEQAVTESEINQMLTEGVAKGVYEEEEPIMVDNIFHLADMNAGDVMTPRTQVSWIDLNDTEEHIMEVLSNSSNYRIPVAHDSLDKLKGLITVSDVLGKILKNDEDKPLKHLIAQCLKDPIMVPESLSLMKLIDTFRTEGVHETVVLDEYGSFSGLVTLHDIMEEIVGLMPSGEEERKEEENRIVSRSENSWLVDGLLDIDEFKEYFHMEEPLPGEEDDLYKTLGGFLTYLFGRIPKEMDKVIWEDYIYEVMDMDNTRIDKILVTYQPKENIEDNK